MLSTRNSGKLLDREWYRVRADILKDRTHYSDEERAFHDVSGADGGGKDDPGTYFVAVMPVDQRTTDVADAHDIRKQPKSAGGDT